MKALIYNIHDHFDLIRDEWNQLSRLTNISYFLSWAWIENWIKTLPPECDVNFVIIKERDNSLAIFFLGYVSATWRSLTKINNQLYLNSTGIPYYDKLFIEYNAILVGHDKLPQLKDLLECLPFRWDEFMMPGMDPLLFPVNSFSEKRLPYKIVNKKVVSYCVNLKEVRKNELNYLGLLSGNTRSQIRRSYRSYWEKGEVVFEVASTLEDAVEFFKNLVVLHNSSWEKRGKSGCFSSKYFMLFHSRLIQQRFSSGEIQLLRLKCGDSVIGCLYNFIFEKKIYFYQSGFVFGANNKQKPGLMLHAEAIVYNASIGYDVYDFLAGESQYKKSLATDENFLMWSVIQKFNIKIKIYNYAMSVLMRLRRKLAR